MPNPKNNEEPTYEGQILCEATTLTVVTEKKPVHKVVRANIPMTEDQLFQEFRNTWPDANRSGFSVKKIDDL